MIHTENNPSETRAFTYHRAPYEIPMRAPISDIDSIIRIADRFAPVLLVFDDRIEIDWDFYSQSPHAYQLLMNQLFLALGIYSTVREGNIEIVHRKYPNASDLLPHAPSIKTPIFFNLHRYTDALEYIKRSHAILKNHPLKPSPHELFAVTHPRLHVENTRNEFNPNEIQSEIIITDRWPWPIPSMAS